MAAASRPNDHERVFDLFRRSGTQDQPGEGIGLAHVRALAYRLGGTIDRTLGLERGRHLPLTLPQKSSATRGNRNERSATRQHRHDRG